MTGSHEEIKASLGQSRHLLGQNKSPREKKRKKEKRKKEKRRKGKVREKRKIPI
jgi:hypothetical protein